MRVHTKLVILISAPLIINHSFLYSTMPLKCNLNHKTNGKCFITTRSHSKLSFHMNKRLQLTFCPQSSCKMQPWCQSSPEKQSFISASFVQGPRVNLHIRFIKSPTSSHGVFEKEQKLMRLCIFHREGTSVLQ